MDGAERSDEELARLIAGGDETAFDELYLRYFARLYDFALRISRDRDIAALVVQSSFLRAHYSLRVAAQTPFRLQLFAGAHYDLAERLRSRREPGAEPEEAFATVDPALAGSPTLAAELPELARTAWRACSEMRLDEYELLDFAVRQRFNSAEIAAMLGTRPEAVERRLASVESGFEESLSAQIVLAHGRQSCIDLDFLVGDESWSVSLRRRVGRHLRSCLTCQGTRGHYPGALALLAALVLAPPPEGWGAIILTRLKDAVRTGVEAPEPVPVRLTPMRPAAQERPVSRAPQALTGGGGLGDWAGGIVSGAGSRGPLLVVLGGAVLVIVIALAALCGAGTFSSGGSSRGATPTISPTRTASATPSVTATGTATITSTPRPVATATPAPPTPTGAPPTATALPPTALPTATSQQAATPTP